MLHQNDNGHTTRVFNSNGIDVSKTFWNTNQQKKDYSLNKENTEENRKEKLKRNSFLFL